ncbi:MAG TPA: alpha/beta fold hydrolase [Pirellulales bacterium]|nr:alpha/beta fold hydrolase [Pirellulales bacterium]
MRTVGIAIATGLSCAVALAGDVPPEKDRYSNHSKLLVYIDDHGREQPVTTLDNWARRKADIAAGMQRAMGPLPSRDDLPPLDMRVTETSKVNGLTRLKLTFVAEENDRVPAWLFLPERAAGERSPAMLALHQTTTIGKDEPAGMGPMKNLHYGLELAQRGYVVLMPDYPSFGEYEFDFKTSGRASGTIKGIFNHMRCVDLLQSREEVDPERIGVIGHSLGGHNAMFVAAFDERLKVVVSSCGWTPFHDYYEGKIAGWTSDRYMPRLRDVYGLDPDHVPFDFYEVVASFAPRAFFSNSPLHDANFEVAGVKKAVAAVKDVYDLFDADDALVVRYPDCEHDFPPEIRKEAYEFIDRALRPTTP